MVLKLFLGLWLSVVIVVGISFPMVPDPRQWYEFPIIPGLEDKVRILFFHVPMAWVTVVAFIVSMIYGIRYLVKKNLDDDIKSVSSASLGLLFCILATVTGSIWAKFNWGSFWNWDPRETSIFVLLLIYGAYFALRSALDVDEKRAALSAVYSTIAGVTVPFFIFIMPRVVASLHPEPIVNAQGKIHMNGAMLVVFLSSLAGFTALYFWMLNLRIRTERLVNQSQP
jgi:heme exporter protein C